MTASTNPVGIIGGTGLTSLSDLEIVGEETVSTRWGEPSDKLVHGRLGDQAVVFLARHGNPHRIPPHQVNYRANLQALYDAGVRTVVGVNAVGGIHKAMGPAHVVVPGQVIDYTWGRASTFFEGELEHVTHIDFTYPYDQEGRQLLIDAARGLQLDFSDFGVYAATQGPRLETAAEISRMARDGCTLVGMTGMPEAGLAREVDLPFASVCLVVNPAAGVGQAAIDLAELHRVSQQGAVDLVDLIQRFCLG